MNFDRRWECKNCTIHALTRVAHPPTPYHPCKGMKGLSVPLVPEGADVKVFATERGDYIGQEDVRLDGEGRPVMNVSIERADGSNDLVVYAPTARFGVSANQ